MCIYIYVYIYTYVYIYIICLLCVYIYIYDYYLWLYYEDIIVTNNMIFRSVWKWGNNRPTLCGHWVIDEKGSTLLDFSGVPFVFRQIHAGWWFGTFGSFFLGNFIIPTDFQSIIFQRWLNHQPVYKIWEARSLKIPEGSWTSWPPQDFKFVS